MNNNTKANSKKIIKTILAIPLILISLVILYIIGFYATAPIFDKIEADKFIKLDEQIQVIHKNLQTASNGTDEWKYSTECDEILNGPWPTGKYICTALISTDKSITTVQELNDLQAKYYPVIDSSSQLKPISELKPEYINDFGKKFVVSGAYKDYTELKSGVACKYSIDLMQDINNPNVSKYNIYQFGSDVLDKMGNVSIELKCSQKANDYWYTNSKPYTVPYGEPLKKL